MCAPVVLMHKIYVKVYTMRPTSTWHDWLTVTHAAALEHLPSRKWSLQEDGDDTSSTKKPKQSSAEKSKVQMRRSRCGKCIGCQPLKKEDCGQCVVCK